MDNVEDSVARLEILKAAEAAILDEVAGVTRMIARYTERVTELGPRLRSIRGEIRELTAGTTSVVG